MSAAARSCGGRRLHGEVRPVVLILLENCSLARDHRLIKQTTSLLANGFTVHLVGPSDPANHDLVPGLVLHEYPAPKEAASRWGYVVEFGLSFVRAAAITSRLAVRQDIAVLQVCGAPDIWFPLARVLRRRGARVIYDQRDPSPELYEARYGSSGSTVLRLLLRLERATYAAADEVLVMNESLAEAARGRGRKSPGQVTVVGNGPVLADVAGRAPRPGLRRGRRFLCVWHGAMGLQDRLDLVVSAVSHVVHDLARTECTFLLLGDGETRAVAEEQVAGLGLDDYVSFGGWLPEAELFSCLAAADVGLESTLDPLVSPVKVMEYMAFGLPVVAFDVLETRRLADGAGSFARPGDSADLARRLVALLDDPTTRDELAATGRRRVREQIAWDHQAPAYVEVCRRLAAGRR